MEKTTDQVGQEGERSGERQDGIDIIIDDVGAENMITDRTRVMALISEQDVNLKDLNEYVLNSGKKRDLDRDLAQLSTMIKERHGYNFDIDRAIDTLWNMKKTDFLNGSITAYYSDEAKPVLFLSDIGIVQAPKVETE